MSEMQRINLTDDYSIPRVIKGGWQLAGGHGPVDRQQAIEDMFTYYNAGITTFDCADIYTGVEDLIGEFRKELARHQGSSALSKIQVHTKYVPDRSILGKLTFPDVETAIRRSIRRLGVESIDLVQFHWWDFSIKQYVEVGLMLDKLQKQGMIRHIGLTNFDVVHMKELVDAGVKILTNQVQYSVLDRRPQKTLEKYCQDNSITMLCYGGLAGGFIGDRYLDSKEPILEYLETNRSLVKYKLIIDDIGGWVKFQEILSILAEIARKYQLSISQVALLYVLSQPGVGAVIVGARNNSHIQDLAKLTDFKLSASELSILAKMLDVNQLAGDIYHLERSDPKHAGIMKYNLNKE
jgi:aryl-alcohol dehydrogenase-like predicted oxidoreductase